MEGLGEYCHKRDGEGFLREGLDEDSHNKNGERFPRTVWVKIPIIGTERGF